MSPTLLTITLNLIACIIYEKYVKEWLDNKISKRK